MAEKIRDAFSSFGFYTVPDLTEEETRPPDFIIEGMIPCGLSFLSGAPKIRKSFMALQMAASVASGQMFLGHSTTKCDVAYLDLEGSKSRISTRAARMTIPLPANVYVANTIERKLANGLEKDIQQLHQQRPEIRFVIVDTFSRARGNVRSGGANAYDSDVSLLEPIQRMAIAENIAVLMVHHDKKGAGLVTDSFERLSGTMGISGSADCVMNLVAQGKRFDGKANFEYTPRDAKGGELNLVFDERYCEWMQLITPTFDIEGNPVCYWIVHHAPEKRKEAQFYSYDAVYQAAYDTWSEMPGDKIREQVEQHRDELFTNYGIGVQLGVKSHGERGLRIINLL